LRNVLVEEVSEIIQALTMAEASKGKVGSCKENLISTKYVHVRRFMGGS
jgi:hypothetical protein